MKNTIILFTTLLFAAILSKVPSFIEFQMRKKGAVPVTRLSKDGELTDKPVIGILTQTLEVEQINNTQFAGYNSYMMTAYVDYIQAAGARVVPLIVGEPREVTLEKLSKLNGVLFPGGGGDYLEYGRFIFETIKQYNDNGTYYPAWGTCLGFEMFAVYASDADTAILESYPIEHDSLTLKFTKDPRDTQMFGWLEDLAFLFEK